MPMLIIAHRGASGHAPENTLSSIKKALELGVDMVEFDVHALPSGEVILMHDLRVNRTTNDTGYVHEKTFTELRALDAGKNEQVPTLNEVLDLIDHRVRTNIEIKGPNSAKAVAAIVNERLTHGWQPSDFLVSSFNHHELHEFKQLVPDVEISALQDGVPFDYASFAQRLGAVAVAPGHEFINEAYVADAHARNLTVYVWTINDSEEVTRMHRMGVDGIFTDYPDVAHKTLAALQK